jgi:hypothetical protein
MQTMQSSMRLGERGLRANEVSVRNIFDVIVSKSIEKDRPQRGYLLACSPRPMWDILLIIIVLLSFSCALVRCHHMLEFSCGL